MPTFAQLTVFLLLVLVSVHAYNDSLIVNDSQRSLLSQWVNSTGLYPKITTASPTSYQWKLCWRGTTNGFSSSKFHQVCNIFFDHHHSVYSVIIWVPRLLLPNQHWVGYLEDLIQSIGNHHLQQAYFTRPNRSFIPCQVTEMRHFSVPL